MSCSSVNEREYILRRSLSVALVLWAGSAWAETTLWMAEATGCYWCAQWNEDIAPIYPKTPQGQTAPLQRYNLHKDQPDIELVRRVTFTPTFILVENGQEVGRIEGYPGPDFFWGLLNRMITEADILIDNQS